MSAESWENEKVPGPPSGPPSALAAAPASSVGSAPSMLSAPPAGVVFAAPSTLAPSSASAPPMAFPVALAGAPSSNSGFPAPPAGAPFSPPSPVAAAPALVVTAPIPPVGPPRLTRPDSFPTSSYRPGWPNGAPPVEAAGALVSGFDGPTTAPTLKPVAGWGWRAFVAFVAGGLLTGGGFAAAQLTQTADDGTLPATPVVTAVSQPSVSPSVPPTNSDTEPAAYVAEILGPSVVQIETDIGTGSGVIYQDGLIMTNNHVIEGATVISVSLRDGRHLPGQLVGSDVGADIAVVSVDKGQGLTPATLASGEKAKVGQAAIAIGSPFKLQQTVTEGIVSAVDRPVPSGTRFTAMIQTDAPINPGNSGGALADRQGRVIGINTAIQTDGASTTNAGIGFAIPIDTALSVANRLVAGEPIESGLLGVRGAVAADGSAGVEVSEVTPGAPAEVAGIQLGDLILSIDGAPVTQFDELAGLVVAHAPGDTVALEIVRNGQPMVINVTLGRR